MSLNKLIKDLTKTGFMDMMGDAVSIQGRDFRVLYQNKLHKDLVGDRTGEYCYKAYQGKDNVCERCQIEMCFKDGLVHTVEQSRDFGNETKYSLNTASALKDESGKIVAGIEVVRDITERKLMENALRNSKDELARRVRERTLELEESNTALKVLLKQREQDQRELEENILSNIKHLILPYVNKLKRNRSMSEELVYLNILESNLQEIVSPFSSKMSFRYLDFTPREILVANLIKDGRQDKDIMDILNISLETVKSHRQNIRKKLGIYGKRSNLRMKLLSFMK